MNLFTNLTPTNDNYWRSIILFGRNVASYKFALGKSLLEMREHGADLVTLEELAEPFSRHICAHLKHSPRQATSASSKLLEACHAFNDQKISQEQLIHTTVRLGFTNGIDAFHIVNPGEIPQRFFLDERKLCKGIRLTDNIFQLMEDPQYGSLTHEVEARWRLVETAWDLGLSKHIVNIAYDGEHQSLYTYKNRLRIDVTSCRNALNGYQKGHCFYCFSPIFIDKFHEQLADVDHFFPNTLKLSGTDLANYVDGIWNLVLACKDCNRGENGKFAKIPSKDLLKRLYKRNTYLISSHHPLRETLIQQMGNTDAARISFLQNFYNESRRILIHEWQPVQRGQAVF